MGVGREVLADSRSAEDCVQYARMFFDRPDFDLASAHPGSYAIAPVAGMIDALRRDYERTIEMVFGAAPIFDEIIGSIEELDMLANASAVSGPAA